MASAMSRLETAVSNIDQAGFFIGYAVSELDAANNAYTGDEVKIDDTDGNAMKKARYDEDMMVIVGVGSELSAAIPSLSSNTTRYEDSNGGSPAQSQHHLHDSPSDHMDKQDKQSDLVHHTIQDLKSESVGPDDDINTIMLPEPTSPADETQSKSASEQVTSGPVPPPIYLSNRHEKEFYDPEEMLHLHQSITPLRTLDQFSCGGRFILNDTDRVARVRFETPEKEIKDLGSICQLAVADILRGHSKISPLNPGQERGDHVAQDLAGDFRISIQAAASTKQPDEATFLEEIRQRCCDVFNIPSVSLRRRYLRIYSKGGYSRPSMATPRVPQRTLATVIVCLPSPFTGGKIVVSHLKIRKSFSFADRSASRDSVQWAAFYSDCEYEIKKIRSGHQALVIYDACVEGDEPMHRRQIYKQVLTRAIPLPPVNEISSLVESVSSFLHDAPILGLFTWYSYTLSALNKAPLTLKGLDRRIYDALSSKFRVILLPVVVRLPYEDDSSRNIRVAAFTRDDIEYMEGVADKPAHEELEPFEGIIPFPLRPDIETFEFCSSDEVETTYFYSAMVIQPVRSDDLMPIAEA